MLAKTNQPNVLELECADMSVSREGWKETKPREALDADVSSQAVQLSGVFPASNSAAELQLVQRLFVIPRKETLRVVAFCGVGPTDAAAFMCARSAEILAGEMKETVCLVNANPKDATFNNRYDLNAQLACSAQMHKAMAQKPSLDGHKLWALPPGACNEFCQSLSRERVEEMLSTLRERFRFVLICLPPLSSAPEGLLLGQMSDGVVLTLQANATDRVTARKGQHLLEAYEIRLLGAVLCEGPANRSLTRFWKRTTASQETAQD